MSARSRGVLLAVDQGSSSTRAAAFDEGGRLLAAARRPVRLRRPSPGRAEHDPEELSATASACLEEVLARLPRRDRVLGAAVASQRSTIVFADRTTLACAGPAPSWMDARARDDAPLEARRARRVRALSGLYPTPFYSAPKIRWALERSPRVRRLAEAGRLVCLPVASFLAARLTRGAALAAEPTCAQRTLLYGLAAGGWHPELLAFYGLREEVLPRIRPSVGEWGLVEAGGRAFPLLAVAGDQQAAAAGLGGEETGASVANLGTGAFLLRRVGPRPPAAPGLMVSAAASRGGFYLEGAVHSAGTAFDWLSSGLGLRAAPGGLEGALRRARGSVLALPALGGLGAPRWDYSVKTAFYGLEADTGPDELVRAAAEGVCQLLADAAEAMARAGAPVGRVRAGGGLAASAGLLACLSEALGGPVERARDLESTAFGAALLAARALGVRSFRVPPPSGSFAPRRPRAERARRRREWGLFVRLCQRLSRERSRS